MSCARRDLSSCMSDKNRIWVEYSSAGRIRSPSFTGSTFRPGGSLTCEHAIETSRVGVCSLSAEYLASAAEYVA